MNSKIIDLVEEGVLELSKLNNGEIFFKLVESEEQDDQPKKPSIKTTIERLEQELYRITNNGFPIPYEKLDSIYPELSEKSIRILLEFSGWLGQHKILLEAGGQFEFSFLFGSFHQLIIQNRKLSSKQKKKLDEIILIHLGLRENLLKET